MTGADVPTDPGEIRKWIWGACREAELGPTVMARVAGLAPSTINRFLSDPKPAWQPSTKTLGKIQAVVDAVRRSRVPELPADESPGASTEKPAEGEPAITSPTDDALRAAELKGWREGYAAGSSFTTARLEALRLAVGMYQGSDAVAAAGIYADFLLGTRDAEIVSAARDLASKVG